VGNTGKSQGIWRGLESGHHAASFFLHAGCHSSASCNTTSSLKVLKGILTTCANNLNNNVSYCWKLCTLLCCVFRESYDAVPWKQHCIKSNGSVHEAGGREGMICFMKSGLHWRVCVCESLLHLPWWHNNSNNNHASVSSVCHLWLISSVFLDVCITVISVSSPGFVQQTTRMWLCHILGLCIIVAQFPCLGTSYKLIYLFLCSVLFVFM